MIPDRDLTTEALAVGIYLLGLPGSSFSLRAPLGDQTPLRFLTWDAGPSLGLYVELSSAYEPELLLVESPEDEASHVEAFLAGARTAKEKLAELKQVLRSVHLGLTAQEFTVAAV